jgi:excisionase family DNA binding protein
MAIVTIYNVDEVVTMLKPKGISKTSIYRAMATGKLKSVKVGKRYLISEEALNNFLNGYTNN